MIESGAVVEYAILGKIRVFAARTRGITTTAGQLVRCDLRTGYLNCAGARIDAGPWSMRAWR